MRATLVISTLCMVVTCAEVRRLATMCSAMRMRMVLIGSMRVLACPAAGRGGGAACSDGGGGGGGGGSDRRRRAAARLAPTGAAEAVARLRPAVAEAVARAPVAGARCGLPDPAS